MGPESDIAKTRAYNLVRIGTICAGVAGVIVILSMLYLPSDKRYLLYIVSGIFAVAAIAAFWLSAKVREKANGYGAADGKKFLWWTVFIVLLAVLLGNLAELMLNYIAFHILGIGNLLWAVISLLFLVWFFKSQKIKTFFSGQKIESSV